MTAGSTYGVLRINVLPGVMSGLLQPSQKYALASNVLIKSHHSKVIIYESTRTLLRTSFLLRKAQSSSVSAASYLP